jgi:tetratricopeptide (TPR) repeat protein
MWTLQVWFSLCFRTNAGVPTIYRMVAEESRWEAVCEKRGWYQCSYRRASAYIEGPNPLTWDGIYHLYQRALTIREQQLGPHHPDTAQSLNNLALLYRVQGQSAQAEPLYQRALAIREQQLGPHHPDTASSLNNLAALYRAQGKDEQAEPLFKQALAIREQQLGPQHPDTAQSVWWLAALSEQQQQYSQAASLYQRALSIDEHALGPQHPTTKTIRANSARLLRTMGHDTEAAALNQP